MSNSNNSKRVTDREVSEFLQKVKTGEIKPDPKKCGHFSHKKYGPSTSFSFPDIGWEIHVHWKSEEKEEIAKAHVKDMKTGKYLPDISSTIESQTIAMLRHHSGLDEEDTYEKRKEYFSRIEEEDKKAIRDKEIGEKEKEKKRLKEKVKKYWKERINTALSMLGIMILSLYLGFTTHNEVFTWIYLPIIILILIIKFPVIRKHKKSRKELKRVEKELSNLRKQNPESEKKDNSEESEKEDDETQVEEPASEESKEEKEKRELEEKLQRTKKPRNSLLTAWGIFFALGLILLCFGGEEAAFFLVLQFALLIPGIAFAVIYNKTWNKWWHVKEKIEKVNRQSTIN